MAFHKQNMCIGGYIVVGGTEEEGNTEVDIAEGDIVGKVVIFHPPLLLSI